MSVLVDTAILSLALRRSHHDLSPAEIALKQELQELIEEGRVKMIGSIRQEILSGFRQEAQFERLRQHLKSFVDQPLTEEDYEEAARIHNKCRAAGITGSSVDFLICAVAIRRNWPVFTTDKDFHRYGRHVPLSLFAPRKYRP